MNCNKCGALNNAESKFCLNCGAPLNNPQPIINEQQNNQVNMGAENLSEGNVQNTINVTQPQQQPPISVQTPVNDNNVMQTNVNNIANTSIDFKSYFIGILKSPLKTVEENESYLESKNSFKFAIIIAIALVVCSLIGVIISSTVYTTWGNELKFSFEMIKYIEWKDIILLSTVSSGVMVFGLPLAYVIGAKILKKDIKYSNIIAFSASGFIPFMLICNILSPIVSKLNETVGLVVNGLGAAITMILVYEFINKKIDVSGDKKVFINIISYAIALISYYIIIYVYYKLTY